MTTTPATHSRDRSLSLLKPTGRLTLGNLLGALRPMAAAQADADCFYGIADLHALTIPHDPRALRALVRENAALLLAAGLDRSTLFVQSRVPAHARLSCLLESVATTGELGRMIQFKEKGREQPSTRTSLYTYPVLMAADILLYRTARVPVGDDQRQHVELTRDLALRFNRTYGEVFTVPEIVTPDAGARVMDLPDPTSKMGKSGADRATKPGVTNLVEVLEACGSADGISTYGALKAAVTDAVVATLEPLQRRHAALRGPCAGRSDVRDGGRPVPGGRRPRGRGR